MKTALHWLALPLAIAASLSAGAAAQTDAAPTKDILIVGQRLKSVLQDFVNSHTQAGPTDQLARWDREFCPRIWGLNQDQEDYVRARMALVAREVGLKTGRGRCPSKLTIVVTSQTRAIAAAVADDFPDQNWKTRAPLRKFVQDEGPVRWVSIVDECTGACASPNSLPNSRLSKATRPRLQAMIILVDSTRLKGISIGQLADFVSLVALSNPPMSDKQDRRSILGLFNEADGTSAQPELTNVDLTFLSALYNVREEFGVGEQRSSIVSQMTKSLRRDSGKAPSSQPQQ